MISTIEIEKPDAIWGSDITYIGTRYNTSYLAIEGSLKALGMALGNRKNRSSPLIHHSDRGLQYSSNEYQKLLKDNGINPSMTEKYDPYKNAIA